MQKIAVQLTLWLLKKQLSLENKSLLISAILDKLSALPIKSIIHLNDNGSLVINGKEIDYSERVLLKDSAKALRENRVFGLIQDQILHHALSFGLNHSVTIDQLYCSKMAVWWGQEENKLLKLIAEENPDLSS